MIAITDLACLGLQGSQTKQGPLGLIGDVRSVKVLHALSLGALGICVQDLINQLLRQATILLIEWPLSTFPIMDHHLVSDQPLPIVLSLRSLSQTMSQLRQARHRFHGLWDLSF